MERQADTDNNPRLQPIALSESNGIVFSPKPRSRRSYGVTIKYFEPGDAQPSKRLDYQIHLKIDQFKNEYRTWQLCFDKRELFIDKHEPDLVAEQLASLSMKAIFPVKVDVNGENEIFRGIVNHQEILSNWRRVSARISDKYEGDVVELFLEKMDHKMNDPLELEYALKLDMFWSVFFHSKYEGYDQNLSRKTRFCFPAIAYRHFAFEGKQYLEPFYTDYGTYRVNFNSSELLSEALRFKMKTKVASTVSVKGQWDLDKDTGLMMHATVDWKLHDGDAIEKRIFFSAYEIDSKIDEGNDNLVVTGKEKEDISERKKGFWARMMS